MGINTLATKSPGDFESEEDFNQYRDALIENNVPRNTAGIPSDNAGSLGSDGIKWLKAKIVKGYWSAGDIKLHHSYDGTVPIDQGWFPCDGTIINETNYDAFHGVGSWIKYVGTSIFDGKYTPDLVGKIMAGTNDTTQDGTSPITTVGDSSIDLTHTHSSASHNHQWYQNNIATSGNALTTTASYIGHSYDSSGNILSLSGGDLAGDYYTDNITPTINSTTDSVTTIPESIEAVHYIRII